MKIAGFLLVVALVSSSAAAKSNSTAPSEVPYYGRSPPVYPSPIGNGSSNSGWAAAYRHARALVSQLTVEEKANITRGWTGTCVGNSGEVPRLGIPALCFADAPDGVRGQEFVSAFPAGIHVAATFDKALLYKYGKALGDEYYGKGINVALGPAAGPLGRVARGGRNWEGLSSDPYLAGVGMGAITRGIQNAGVIATAKHWLLNEQEYRRRVSDLGEAISSNVDDRALHELYVWPFMNSLKEGAASVMCSYQRSNHSYGCQNSKLLNGILKTELGFEGFVVSDWEGQMGGVASANAGLDLVMPDEGFWGDKLIEAVNNGSVTEDRLSDMATRILAGYHFLHQEHAFPAPAVHSNLQKAYPVDVQDDHASLIRQIGAAGTVLVKNTNHTLPLKNPKFLSIYGYDATVKAIPWENPSRYGGGYEVNFGWETFNGTLITGGGSGGSTPPYVVSPFQAIQERISKNRGILRWNFYSENPSPPYVNSEACLVFINAYASESFDRLSLTDEFSDNLVQNVAANCSNTVVMIHSAGIRTVDAWIEHPNVTALPFTIARQESDYGSHLNSSASDDFFPDSNFTEGLYIDYRYFDAHNITPRYEFGFGLSYTTFSFADLSVELTADADTSEYPDPNVSIVQGGHPSLWETVAVAKVSLTNTGDVDGAEVAQLYIGVPGDDTPIRQLRGFSRVFLSSGQTQSVAFELTRRDLSIWDVEAQQWRLRRGTYNVWSGSSSRNLVLQNTIEIK
ncbi:glycosyl hydrolase family 3 N terminal domain-containing protein [Colletotrichum tamarilloi]|uniref:beta-glucosidase n=1 Tax=Colletotrichum tamarilloi TaxID=1209934 RepID=A0ABQ9QKV6_9PEZI|nr:glycosyl hydrolase family 3 N terminal domain-containing protein [Colletotrichum tamarilloi]KAK1475190.1 glycosyl hydrolase family 3 N terminal domain-containing protein [Colletotrichum tamarilloi]